MTRTTLTSREFNHDASRAKKAARLGPVIITDRGTPSHVLLTIEDYQKLTQQQPSIAEQLACNDAADVDFEPGRLESLTKKADLT